jgi:hypothetical protein
MTLTNSDVLNLLYNMRGKVYLVIGERLRNHAKERGIPEYSCVYCGGNNNVVGCFCQDLNLDPDIDSCAEKFYQENQDLLLEIITE